MFLKNAQKILILSKKIFTVHCNTNRAQLGTLFLEKIEVVFLTFSNEKKRLKKRVVEKLKNQIENAKEKGGNEEGETEKRKNNKKKREMRGKA